MLHDKDYHKKNEPNNVIPLSKWNSCAHAHTHKRSRK